jgi:hypothetical protein
VPGHPGHAPWGHHRTWGSARDYWRTQYGYGGGPEYGRDFWRYAPGHPHHHTPIGRAVLSALLPFPFNLLLGHKHHHDRAEVVREPVPEFWHRAPNEFRYDPFRAIWRHMGPLEGASAIARMLQPAPLPEVVWRDPPVREIVREVVVREPVREYVRPEITLPLVRREVVEDFRPRPLYHLSFGRPMSEHELRRYLTFVPQLRAHPDGVLAEMAGLLGQARDVRGVDATTGEYLLLPGETLADVAHKLVGERRRWRELEAANPMRAEGDPRLRIPPSWFGYVPYSIPIERLRELRELRREGEVSDPNERDATEASDAPEVSDDAGYVRGRYPRRAWRRRTYRPYSPNTGFRSFGVPQPYWGDDPNGGDPDMDAPDADDASGPRAVATPRRRYRVTHFDALGTLSPTYTRETAEQIVMQHKLFDGQRVLRPDWWAELRDVNPQKPLTPEGWWRDIREGEFIWIPDFWPLAKPEPGPETADAGGVWDALAQLNPFGAAASGNRAGPMLDDPAPVPMILPETTISETVTNTGPRQAISHQTYSVVRGDWPQKIAQKLGAQGRVHWLSELQRANPHKPVSRATGNWFNLYAGEVVNIPNAWSGGSTDAGRDEDAGLDAAWISLTEVQTRAPYFTPLANYFRGTRDADGSWVRYATALVPYFEGVAQGDALEAVLDASCAGFFMAVPGASGPVGWRKATGNELRCFPQDVLRQVQAGGITFWVEPAYGVSPVPSTNPEDSLDVPTGNMGPRPTVTRQTYSVVRGDWPQKIARRFGAQGRVHWLSELQAANPHKLTNRTTGNWSHLDANEVVNIPDAWVSVDTGEAEDDADAGALRQNLTRRTYAVVAGDGMQRIAQKLGAVSMGSWFSDLRDANPQKKMAVNAKGKQLAWESLYPGEIINIPDTWPDMPLLRPAPGGVPTQAPYPGLSQFPAFPGGAVPSPTAPPGTVPAAATVDPGTMLRVQAILIAFRQIHPDAIVPKDFGTGMPFSPDATGVLTQRTQQALASFQRWSNAMAGSRLRSDGVLDPDTIAALDSFSAQAIGGLAQRPPVVPIGGANPASGDGNPLAGLLGAAAASAGDLARRVAPPAAPSPGGAAPDPFAGAFQAAGDFVRNLGGAAQPGGDQPYDPPGRRRPRGDFDPRPAAPVLHELPEALQQYGIPGVPGLPGGAPHAPPPRRPRVDAPPPPPDALYDAPPESLAPVAKPAPSDGSVVPLVLVGLGILAGVLV